MAAVAVVVVVIVRGRRRCRRRGRGRGHQAAVAVVIAVVVFSRAILGTHRFQTFLLALKRTVVEQKLETIFASGFNQSAEHHQPINGSMNQSASQ